MSDNEWITQVAHQKWANERITCFFEQITHFSENWRANSQSWLFDAFLVICIRSTVHFAGLGLRSFALSLQIAHCKEGLWAICSCCSLQKSDHEWFPQVALYKRATWANCSGCSLKKSDVIDSLMISAKHLQKTSDWPKKIVFLYVFALF